MFLKFSFHYFKNINSQIMVIMFFQINLSKFNLLFFKKEKVDMVEGDNVEEGEGNDVEKEKGMMLIGGRG